LWTTKERKRKHASFEKTINVSRVYNFLKCHRNVSNQTNPTQVDNLITYKPMGNSEASRRIVDTHSVKISVLENTKKF